MDEWYVKDLHYMLTDVAFSLTMVRCGWSVGSRIDQTSVPNITAKHTKKIDGMRNNWKIDPD